MIEVEKSYIIKSQPELNKFLQNFTYVFEKNFEDIYFDTNNYDFLKQQKFLRIRMRKKLELSIVVSENDKRITHEYVYMFTDKSSNTENDTQKILLEISLNEEFNPNSAVECIELLNKASLNEFLTINTTKKTYKQEGVIVDVDYIKPDLIFMDIEQTDDTKNNFNNAIEQADNNSYSEPFSGKFVACSKKYAPAAYKIFEKYFIN